MKRVAEIVVKTCLGLRPDETLLVITDPETETVGRVLFEAGLKEGAKSVLMVIGPLSRHGEEPPKPVAEAWIKADVFLAPTKFSLTHTQARLRATQAGARGATLPGITPEIFQEAVAVDYEQIKQNCEKLGGVLKRANSLRIISPLGTDLEVSIEGRPVMLDTGILRNPGDFGNLPAGEVYVAPLEGTAQGTAVFDGSFAGLGLLKEPLEVRFEHGYAVKFTGNRARELEELLRAVQTREAYNLAEVGVGCNPKAKIVGKMIEDEKVHGTLHLALGDNSTIGGKVRAGIHLDGLIKNPTLLADGEELIKDGQWLI